MVDRLVAVDDADYRLPEPVLQALGVDVGDAGTTLGAQINATIGAVAVTQAVASAAAARALGWTIAQDPEHAGADDTETLRNAIAAAGAGGTVWLGAGKQWVCDDALSTGSVLTLLSFQRLAGASMELGSGGTGPAMISFPNLTGTAVGITSGSSCTISDVLIAGPGSAVGTCTGLYASGTNGSAITLERVSFQKWYHGTFLSTMFYVKADRCEWRWNTIGLRLDGCYNTNLNAPKFTCSNEDLTSYGTGIQIGGNGCRALSIYGGSIENYGSIVPTAKRAGIHVLANNTLINLWGTYFETRTTTGQASGISFASRSNVTVNAFGCMVYLGETRAWIEASSAIGGALNAGGNAFVCTVSTTPAAPAAYLFSAAPNLDINLGVGQVDQWEQVTLGGTVYCTGQIFVTDRVSKNLPVGAGGIASDFGRDIRSAGSVRVAASKVVQTGRAATGSRPVLVAGDAGALFYDTTLNRPIWWTGTAWADAAGVAV